VRSPGRETRRRRKSPARNPRSATLKAARRRRAVRVFRAAQRRAPVARRPVRRNPSPALWAAFSVRRSLPYFLAAAGDPAAAGLGEAPWAAGDAAGAGAPPVDLTSFNGGD